MFDFSGVFVPFLLPVFSFSNFAWVLITASKTCVCVCIMIMQTLLSIVTPRREITEAADVIECDFVGVSDPWRIADKGRPK